MNADYLKYFFDFEKCWNELTPSERWKYHREVLYKYGSESLKELDAVRRAVLEA